MASERETLLRTEAAPLDYELLLGMEQDVFRKVLSCLKTAVHQDRAAERVSGARLSRVALISGARGQGKTTVMLSLMREFREADKGSEGVRRDVWELANRVIWLEPLAMERLARSTNFIAAILVRIQHAIDHLDGEMTLTSRHAHAGLLDCLSDSPVHRLHALTSEVALAWEGNLAERAAHVDPDTFSMEVVRAEKARLSLNEKFGKLLDDLAADITQSHARYTDPIFVFPVDDFDVNPHRCLELLRFLRILSVPRMFSLVLGDEEMIEAVFQLNAAGELAHPAGRTGWPGDKDLKAHIATTSAGIASQALRKLIPVGQRFRLRPMTVEEALEYKPLGIHGDGRALKDLLAQVRVNLASGGGKLPPDGAGPAADGGKEEISVLDMISAEGPFGGGPFYTARKLLEAPPRHIADLWFMLDSVTSGDPKEFALNAFCAELASQLIGEDTYLRDSHRRSAVAVVRRIGHVNWQPGDWPLDFAYSSGHRSYVGTHVPACTIGHAMLWDWRRGINYRTKDRESRTPAPRFEERLGNDKHEWRSTACGRTIAGLTLVRDIVSRGFGETGPRLSAWGMPLVWAEWETTVFIPWFFARWSTFWEYERFLTAWRSVLDSRWKYKSDEDFVDALGYMWLAIPVAMTIEPTFLGAASELGAPVANRWKQLSEKLVEMNKEADKHKVDHAGFREFVDTFLVTAACLSCPESGLSDAAAGGLASDRLMEAWRTGAVRRRILKARTHFLELFFEQGLYKRGQELVTATSQPFGVDPSMRIDPAVEKWLEMKWKSKPSRAKDDEK
jgi:hypothetical protein